MSTPLEQFIDTALAAAVALDRQGQIIYVDIYPHQTAIAAVAVEPVARLEKTDVVSAAGFATLHEIWAQRIAQRFIDHTRFDPLYSTASRQALFDALPQWLEHLAAHPDLEVALTIGGERHAVTLASEDLRIAAGPVYERILKRLRRLRRAGQPTAIDLSQRAAALPGLLARLGELRDASIAGLDSSAAAGGSAPTHVLYRGQAYTLGPQPLVVGLASLLDVMPAEAGIQAVAEKMDSRLRGNDGRSIRHLQISGATAGISPRHCSLLRTPQGAVVVDHSRYGTWLNDEVVFERAPLRAGDRLRVGSPGVTLELIAID